MSLDVYLEVDTAVPITDDEPMIFVREDGMNKQISRAEWDEHFPGREPVTVKPVESKAVYSANITHNLNTMAEVTGIYECLWRPEEIGIAKAQQLVTPLETGLTLLKSNPEHFKKFNPQNGWGTYEGFVEFVEGYLEACKENPDADVRVWR